MRAADFDTVNFMTLRIWNWVRWYSSIQPFAYFRRAEIVPPVTSHIFRQPVIRQLSRRAVYSFFRRYIRGWITSLPTEIEAILFGRNREERVSASRWDVSLRLMNVTGHEPTRIYIGNKWKANKVTCRHGSVVSTPKKYIAATVRICIGRCRRIKANPGTLKASADQRFYLFAKSKTLFENSWTIRNWNKVHDLRFQDKIL